MLERKGRVWLRAAPKVEEGESSSLERGLLLIIDGWMGLRGGDEGR